MGSELRVSERLTFDAANCLVGRFHENFTPQIIGVLQYVYLLYHFLTALLFVVIYAIYIFAVLTNNGQTGIGIKN